MRTIQIADYDPQWPEMYNVEAKLLSALLNGCLVRIHHIGSTAVPDLPAKPTIDIMLEVASLNTLENHYIFLEQAGYKIRGENGIPGRRYFTKGDDIRTHQVHAFLAGDPHIHRHLAFRDYLRKNKDIRNEYAAIKRLAAQQSENDISLYCHLKEPFIQFHQTKALQVNK